MDVINCSQGKDIALIIESDGDIAANDYKTIKSVRVRNVLIK